MEANEKEKVKSRTKELLKEIYEDKCAIASIEDPSIKEKTLEKYMQTEYTKKRREIIELNLDFIIARVRIITRTQNEKLIPFGIDGMAKAIDKFDYEKGFTLLTYAQDLIDRYIRDGNRQLYNDMGIGEKTYDKIMAVVTGSQRDLSIPEIAEMTGIPQDTVKRAMYALNPRYGINNPSSEEGGYTLEDVLPNGEEPVDIAADKKRVREEIRNLIRTVLNEQQQKVVLLKYGFLNGIPLNNKKTAQILGITGERVRQIDNTARKILRKYIDSSCAELFDVSVGGHSRKAS